MIEFDPNDFNEMATKTKELMAREVKIIYKATFIENDVLVITDIMVRNGNGYEIY